MSDKLLLFVTQKYCNLHVCGSGSTPPIFCIRYIFLISTISTYCLPILLVSNLVWFTMYKSYLLLFLYVFHDERPTRIYSCYVDRSLKVKVNKYNMKLFTMKTAVKKVIFTANKDLDKNRQLIAGKSTNKIYKIISCLIIVYESKYYKLKNLKYVP